MFGHNFKYTLKYLFRNRMLIFWTFAFPIILGALFYMAFSNIENSEKLDIIDIAVVENKEAAENGQEEQETTAKSTQEAGGIASEQYAYYSKDEILKEALESLSDEDSAEQMFNLSYVSAEKAEKLLEDKEITGYLVLGGEQPKIVVKESGINETIFQYVVSEILQTSDMVEELTEDRVTEAFAQNPSAAVDVEEIVASVMDLLEQEKVNIRDVSGENLSYTMIEYYTLIAMSCLYAATIGMYAINCVLANMSRKGMRISVSPARKGQLVLSGICASYVVQLLGLGLLFLFTIFVLKVDYGTRVLPVVLLALVGSLAGLSLGIAMGALVRKKENTKIGLIIAITMLCCYLSGMMGITMKYVIDTHAPFVNKINPASMITDGFYALYYYETLDRYWFDIGSLLVFAALMLVISFWSLKRQRYESL